MTSAQPFTSMDRQLELTVNALARSMRKALRNAEKADPTGVGGLWKVVEHRARMLQEMMKMAGEFMQKRVPQAKSEPGEGDTEPAVVTVRPAREPAKKRQPIAQGANMPAETAAAPSVDAAARAKALLALFPNVAGLAGG